MSPIIDIQRRMVQVGRIRLGTKQGNRPVRLDTWRLTSRDRKRLDAAAEIFGGNVQEWEGRQGEYELITEVADLPIMLLPGQTLTQWLELWSGGGCKRRCDGDTETISDGPCLCDPEKPDCKPHTRLNVMLPDVPGLGMWRLDSTGWNAARELAGTAEFLEQATARGELLPARLRIDQRVEIRDGQTKRFPVPVLDVDIRSLDALRIHAGLPSVEPAAIEAAPSYRALPVAAQPGVSVQDGLAAAARQAEPKTRSARSAEPIGPAGDFTVAAPVPVPDEAETVPVDAIPFGDEKKVENGDGSTTTSTSVAAITQPQARKLNVLVGKLLDAGHITREQLYAALARERQIDADTMIGVLDGARDANGLHWGPLRDSLTKTEASALIERLSKLEEKAAA